MVQAHRYDESTGGMSTIASLDTEKWCLAARMMWDAHAPSEVFWVTWLCLKRWWTKLNTEPSTRRFKFPPTDARGTTWMNWCSGLSCSFMLVMQESSNIENMCEWNVTCILAIWCKMFIFIYLYVTPMFKFEMPVFAQVFSVKQHLEHP